MSNLSRSLQKRIEELRGLIQSHRTELSAYEQVLQLENEKENSPNSRHSFADAMELAAASQPDEEETSSDQSRDGRGSKTALVIEVVKSFGKAGASPKDVDAHFSSRNIARGKNAIYNTLSYLVAQHKLERQNGRYVAVSSGGAATKKSAARSGRKSKAVAQKRAAAKKSVTPTKRRLSPEGLKRIQEALRKRWAAKRASQASSAEPKKQAKKS